jgi:hypothetical protein
VMMVADEFPEQGVLSPATTGCTSAVIYLQTSDVDAAWPGAGGRGKCGPPARGHLALEGRLPNLLAAAARPARTCLTSHPAPATPGKEPAPAQSEQVPAPSTSGSTVTRRKPANQTPQPKIGITRSVTSPARTLNHRGQQGLPG